MFNLKPQLSQGWSLAVICLLNLLMQQPTNAEPPPVQGDQAAPQSPPLGQLTKDFFAGASLNNLYDNLLQREYAGPVVFPSHQMERKAQRSPSLRLRFGRSDPDMLNNLVEKRWFGDVNQKPIRSPSLRLRFGRRDPNLPQMRRTPYDDLLERELTQNSQLQQLGAETDADLSADYDEFYKRVVRKPQRLRWGRSVPQFEDNEENDKVVIIKQGYNKSRCPVKFQINAAKIRSILMALQFDGPREVDEEMASELEEDSSEFQREARKPMRLRWGRSTGKAPSEQK
ncbi:hypothetical protein KR018_010108, partial [Drosophila ironensis]